MTIVMVEAALEYAARGWKVFPIQPGTKIPYQRTHGVLECSGAPDQIEDWWRRQPDAGIGIATGLTGSGLVVLDIDPKNGGEESLVELQKRIGRLADTPEVITGSGGRHLYFTCTGEENEPHNAAGLMGLPGLDLRGWHGYVVAPPSRNAVGPYFWDPGTEALPFAPFPEALVVHDQERRMKAAEPVGAAIPTGMRNNVLMSLAGSMRRRGLTADEIHGSLWRVAQRCVDIPKEAHVRQIAENAARYEPVVQEQPTDEAGEHDLIGACILGGTDVISRVLGLGITSGDFHAPTAQKAFSAIESLHLGGDPIDIATIRSEADRLASRSDGYLTEYLDTASSKVPDALNAEQYAVSVLERSARRQVLRVGSRLKSIAYSPADDRTALLGKVAAEFDGLLRKQTDVKIMSAFDLAMRHAHILSQREMKDPAVVGLPTGYPSLDAVVAYLPGELWYVAARPSVGKTLILKELQHQQAKQGVPSLFVSVEQPSMQLVDRNLATMSGINSRQIQTGEMTEPEWNKVNKAVEDFSKLPIHMIDDSSMTTAKLDAAVRLAVARHGIRVVFVDYVQILADEYGHKEYERITYISRRLREIARTTGTTLVVACQLSREAAKGKKGRPQLHHLRESGALEQDAFVVLGLSRPLDSPAIDIEVLKNRNGESGVQITLGLNVGTLRLTEIIQPYAARSVPLAPVVQRPEPTVPVVEQTQLIEKDRPPLN